MTVRVNMQARARQRMLQRTGGECNSWSTVATLMGIASRKCMSEQSVIVLLKVVPISVCIFQEDWLLPSASRCEGVHIDMDCTCVEERYWISQEKDVEY